MAEEAGGGSGGGRSDVLFIVLLIGGLVLAWIVSGAYKGADVRSIFLTPPIPQGGKQLPEDIATLGDITRPGGTQEEVYERGYSSERGSVVFINTIGASATAPDEEYVVLQASPTNRDPVTITNWRIESRVSGKGGTIGPGVLIFSANRADPELPIVLRPGEEVVVVSGRSPVGTNFKENRCVGYLSQFQSFTPSLSSFCPRGQEEADASFDTFRPSDLCYDYLGSIPPCRLQLSFPDDVDSSCRAFVQTRLTYEGCVAAHQHEPGFYTARWRVYLRSGEELWKERRETLKLLDASGSVVDTVSY